MRSSIHHTRLAFALAVLLADPVSAQITGVEVPEMAHYDTAVQDVFDDYDIPGGVVAVVKDGRLVYARGFGLADVDAAEAVEPDARFRVASISKPITAMAVMKLVEDGALALDEPAFALLPDLPPPAGQSEDPRLADVTIRDLLQHSGGWDRDGTGYDPMFDVVAIANALGITPPADDEAVIRYMRGRPLDFDPGTRYSYSNFGYAVLGAIVTRVAGQPYEDYVRDLLAEAGATQMEPGRSLLEDRLPGEVRYYEYNGATTPSVFPPHALVPWPYGGFYLEAMDAHGGWVTSAPDLLRFMEAIDGRPFRPDVLSPQSIAAMTARPNLPDWQGTSYWYGLGLLVNTFNNWWHDGSLPGTRAYVIRTQFQNLSYCVITNTRPEPENGFLNALDVALWDAAVATNPWPTHDLFGLYTAAEPAPTPASFTLSAAPNPFAGHTTLTLTLDAPQPVRIAVFDALGRRVAVLHDGEMAAGTHRLRLDAAGLPGGAYLVRASGAAGAVSRQVTVLR